MDLSISMQALKHLFSFPFHDTHWKEKLLIGAAFTLASMMVPVLPWLPVLGYGARLVRAGAANQDPARLPEWDDWGELMLDGLRMTAALLVFLLPSIVVGLVGFGAYFGTAISASAFENSPRGGGFVPVFFFSLFFLFFSMALSTLMGIGAMLLLPAAQARVAVTRRMAALFEVGGWWRVLRANLGGFLLVLLLATALYFGVMVGWQILYFTIVLCMFAPVLLAPVVFYALVVYYRLAGQAYGEGVSRLAESPAPADVAADVTEAWESPEEEDPDRPAGLA